MMKERNLHIDLIEKYLDDTLNDEEATLFNETLENNEEFVRELNDMELLIEGIKLSASKTTLEEKIERFEAKMLENENEEHKKTESLTCIDFIQIKKYSWAVAASLTILMVSTFSIINIRQSNVNQRLYATYFTPLENDGIKRSAESTTKDYWKDALHYYDREMYQEALDCFDQIIITDFKQLINHPRYTLYKLYKGNTLMMLNRHTEAMSLFEGIIDDGDGMIMQARWYLSMCYLHEKKLEHLMPLLEEMSKVESSFYGQDAKKILHQLK